MPRLALLCIALLLPTLAAGPSTAGRFAATPLDIRSTAPDSAVAADLAPVLEAGRVRIETFFGEPFAAPVRVDILPDRAAFTASFPPEWGLAETQCWMVATGVADRLTLLSPRAWPAEACEHDPADAQHVAGILVHELVHVYHGQHNPTGDFTGAESLGWFIEGLAVYVSGQLELGHLESAREAVAGGAVPTGLANAWSGQHRYGVCGTIVRHLDAVCGRDRLRAMLSCTSQDELLGMAGLGEEELLAGWRASLAGP